MIFQVTRRNGGRLKKMNGETGSKERGHDNRHASSVYRHLLGRGNKLLTRNICIFAESALLSFSPFPRCRPFLCPERESDRLMQGGRKKGWLRGIGSAMRAR